MYSIFKNRKLFHQFVITLIITIFLPIIIIGSISYYRASKQIESLVTELLDEVVGSINSQFDEILDENNFLLLQTAAKEQVKQFVGQDNKDYYQKLTFKNWIEDSTMLDEMFLRVPIISGLSVIGDNGAIYSIGNNRNMNAITYEIDTDDALQRSVFLKESLPEDGSMKTLLTKMKNSGGSSKKEQSYYITMGRRVFGRSGFSSIGSVVIDIKAETLNKVWEKRDLKEGNISIIDQSGQFVYNPDKSKIGTSADELIASEIFKSDRGSFKKDFQNEKQFVVYNRSPHTGWKVLAVIPAKNLSVPVENLRNIIIFTCLVSFPLSMLIGYLFIRSILKPIFMLQGHMRKAQAEDWKLIDDNVPQNEIGNLINSYNKMVKKISNLIETVYKGELEQRKQQMAKQKAEFQALQTQINPHFLYNTLGTINSYAIIADDTPIQEMVEALSYMFRYSVQNPTEAVKLSEEVGHVKNYLLIQSYRHKTMPQIQWNLKGFLEHPVIRLTLQPLVENVFHHAFKDGIENHHRIVIGAYEEEDVLIVYVEDNGCGVPWNDKEDVLEGNNSNYKLGIGVKNVHRRIKLAYGEPYGLDIKKIESGGTVVNVKIPLNVKAKSLDFAESIGGNS